MLSDEQIKLVAHAAEVLRALGNLFEDAYDEAHPEAVGVLVDARDTADKLDRMHAPKKSTGVSYEVGSGSRDLDETKPQGLTRRVKPLFSRGETEMA
jgi:hypothetical protein